MSESKLPLDRLRDVLVDAIRPLLVGMQQLTVALNRVSNGSNGSSPADALASYTAEHPVLGSVGFAKGEPMVGMEPFQPAPGGTAPFDMQTLIQESGKWECGSAVHTDAVTGEQRGVRCADCSIDQNIGCLTDYDLLGQAEQAVGHVETDEETRRRLHAVLRDDPAPRVVPATLPLKVEQPVAFADQQVVPVARLTAVVERRRGVRKPPAAAKPAPYTVRETVRGVPFKPGKPIKPTASAKGVKAVKAVAKAAAKGRAPQGARSAKAKAKK
jgi:hypothetical protein